MTSWNVPDEYHLGLFITFFVINNPRYHQRSLPLGAEKLYLKKTTILFYFQNTHTQASKPDVIGTVPTAFMPPPKPKPKPHTG